MLATITESDLELDFLCSAFSSSSIQEEKKITDFDFSGYMTSNNTIDIEAFFNAFIECISLFN